VTIPGIPILQELHHIDKEVHINPEEMEFERATIVVVDDVESNRKFFKDALRQSNLNVREAENGEKALNLAIRIKPDLIITDVRMPGMNGFQLLEKIKSDEKLKDIPVIAYSASVMKSQMERIYNSQFSGVLTKPTKINDLYLELINHLPHRIIETEPQHVDGPAGNISEQNLSLLIGELENDLYKTWEKLRNRQPINEVKEFGKDINALGEKYEASGLIAYGEGLVNAAEQFNVNNILLLLKKYPDKIEEMKKSQIQKK
jgi:two-component system sensor histidine kinase EvgS